MKRKRYSYDLGGEPFETKKSVVSKCKYLLDVYIDRQVDKKYDGFLIDLLRLHPDSKEMFGIGAKHFSVHSYQGSRCFFIHRLDGTETSFSYYSCLNPRSLIFDMKTCFRREILQQIYDFRNENIQPQKCPLCQSKMEFVHVDHVISFKSIMNDFIAQYPMTCDILGHGTDQNRLNCPWNEEDKHSLWLSDRSYAAKWYEYHKAHAVLRFICRSCNLKRPK